MRYETLEDLPDTLKDVLPEEAQKIYLEAYQEAWDAYKPEVGGDLGQAGMAHRDAWHAMKQEFIHDEKKGRWYKRDEVSEEELESEEEEEGGFLDNITDNL